MSCIPVLLSTSPHTCLHLPLRRAALETKVCEVIPAYGDPNGSHVTINVVSSAFEGKRSVQRQQMVYKVSRATYPTWHQVLHTHYQRCRGSATERSE